MEICSYTSICFSLVWEQGENKSYTYLYLTDWLTAQHIIGSQSMIVEKDTYQEKPLWMFLFSPVDEYRRYSDLKMGLALRLGALTSGSKARDIGTSLSRTICFQWRAQNWNNLRLYYNRKTSSSILCLKPLQSGTVFTLRGNTIPSWKRNVLYVINSLLHVSFPYFPP